MTKRTKAGVQEERETACYSGHSRKCKNLSQKLPDLVTKSLEL